MLLFDEIGDWLLETDLMSHHSNVSQKPPFRVVVTKNMATKLRFVLTIRRGECLRLVFLRKFKNLL